MNLAKRTEDEIKQITITPDLGKYKGWAVVIDYKDGKSAALGVDYGDKLPMLDYVIHAIERQMAGNNG